MIKLLTKAYYIAITLLIIFCAYNTYAIRQDTSKLLNEYTIKVCGEVFVMPKQDIKAGGY